jgi:NAD(P)-dependent dehydrogenase (short-subunit alcohol dehydrogenase family)
LASSKTNTGPRPYYAPLAELDIDNARRNVDAHLFLAMLVARYAAKKVRPVGTLLFMSGTNFLAVVQTAMLSGLPYTTLRDAIVTHPTPAEGLTVLLAIVPAKRARKSV